MTPTKFEFGLIDLTVSYRRRRWPSDLIREHLYRRQGYQSLKLSPEHFNLFLRLHRQVSRLKP